MSLWLRLHPSFRLSPLQRRQWALPPLTRRPPVAGGAVGEAAFAGHDFISPDVAANALERIQLAGERLLEQRPTTSTARPTLMARTYSPWFSETKTSAVERPELKLNLTHLPSDCGDRARDPGNCTSFHLVWTFSEGECVKFVYGGCFGSRNKFESQEECRKSECKCRIASSLLSSSQRAINFP